MFKIKNGAIYHTRGDTADFDLEVDFKDRDSVSYSAVLSVKKNIKDTLFVFQVRSDNEGHFSIPHSKTQNLPFGEYVYDIEIKIDDDSVEGWYSTIGPFPYYLIPDVTT